MKSLIITGLTASLSASANYFADRLHTQIDNLMAKDMDMSRVSLSVSSDDMALMHEIAQQPDAQSLGLATVLSPEQVKNGRLSLSLQQTEKVFESASLLA